MLSDYIAEWLFNMEERAKIQQVEYVAEFAKERVDVDTVLRYIPVVHQPVFEPEDCRLIAIFYEGLAKGKIAYHLVFNDERFPIGRVDRKYRKLRMEKYGRTTDVETVIIDTDNLYAIFKSTYSAIEPYEMSLHFSAMEFYGYSRGVYVSTWNHMMRTTPSKWIQLRGGYVKVRPEVIIEGNRRDAERFKEVE